jgi:hypothetical protein
LECDFIDIDIDRKKEPYDDFLKNYFSYAVIVKTDIGRIEELKRFLASKNFTVCFQKISTNKLYIKEDRNNEGDVI